MNPGQKVRIITDPGREGVLSERKQVIGRRIKRGVQFPDGHEYILEGLLELVPEGETLEDIIQSGKFSGRQVLRNSITYRRLSGRLANVIYSMESTDTDFYPYQFKPVLNLLDSPSKSLLIADEVGLGKTIEAGLIWTELRSRYDANKLLVICPAMLREKWKRELRNRFGVQAEMADANELLSTLRQSVRGEINGFALICSKDGLRPPRGFDDSDEDTSTSPRGALAKFLSDREADAPLFDLVIIDEAHYMRNQESMTSKLGRLIRPVADYLVMLSATPIQMASEDLFQLLRILDDQTFSHAGSFQQILLANAPINRLYEALQGAEVNTQGFGDLVDRALAHPLLKHSRQLAHLKSAGLTDAQLQDTQTRAEIAADLEKINLLSKTVSRTRKRQVTEWRVIRDAIPEYVQMNSLEEQFYTSVTESISEYCSGRDISKGFLLTMPQRQIASCMPAALRAWQEKLSDEEISTEIYDDLGWEMMDKLEQSSLGPLTAHLVAEASRLGSYELLKRSDSKYARIEVMLKQFFREYPDEKIVIFTYFRQTIYYLQERLEEAGIKVKILMGSMKENKDDAINKFRDDPSIRVLVSSEVASEGVDIQFCRVLINYDLPWNPMKVEQRIGRLDRIGQKAEKITIWNLFYADTVDARIYSRLHERLEIFEFALGGMEAVLGDEITRLSYDLLAGKLNPAEQEARIKQTEQALANLKRSNEELEGQASFLVAHSEYILKEVAAAKSMQRYISSEDLASYFIDYFTQYYPGTIIKQLVQKEKKFEISLSADGKSDFSEFLRKSRFNKVTFLVNEQSKPVRFIFDNKTKKSDAMTEVINQFHPAIQFINLQLKGHKEQLIPTAIKIRALDANVPKGSYAFFVKRWQISGVRESERLAYAAIDMNTRTTLLDDGAEMLVNTAANVGVDWLAAQNLVDKHLVEKLYEKCEDLLEEAYRQYVGKIERENADRADVLSQTAKSHFEGQIDRFQQLISRFRFLGKVRMIPATEGKIKSSKLRMKERLKVIEGGRNITYAEGDVALGVIEVH